MKKTLLSITLAACTAMGMMADEPTAVLTFASSQVGQSTRLGLVASDGFQVDWGDGNLIDYTSGAYYTETLKGQTVKLYGDFRQIVANSVNLTDVNLDGCPNMQQLQMNYNAFPSLNLSHMTNLTGLYAEGGAMTSLDVAGCTALRVLDVSENRIAGTLDCSGMAALTKLDCGDNLLTTVLLPKQQNIYQVDVRNNLLTSLDVTGLGNVTELDCQENRITSLDLTGMTKLEDLYAYDNAIETINISGVPGLKTLSLSDNQIAAIDLSTCPNLEGVHLTNNNLSTINLSQNTGVRYLNIGGNQLAELNTTMLSQLSRLTCENNQLTELDLSGNANLYVLYADHNQLSDIDLSVTPRVYDLNLAFNQLANLDLSRHNLYYVQVNDNQLSTLDLSSSNYLYRLAAENNQLTDVTFASMSYLQGLTLQHNRLTAERLTEIINALPDVTNVDVTEYNQSYAKIFGYDALPGVDGTPATLKGWQVTGYAPYTAITGVNGDAQVVRTVYYGINGTMMTSEPESGVYIARDMLVGGQSRTRKVVK